MKNLRVTVNGTPYEVQVEEINGAVPAPTAAPAGQAAAPAPQAAPTPAPQAAPTPVPQAAVSEVPADAELISAPMPGTIVSVNVKAGQSVKKGDTLLVLEAMKMENEIMSPHDAVVAATHVNKGDTVDSGTPLVSLH